MGEGLEQAVRGDHRPHRCVARRHALRTGDDVRRDAVTSDRERFADAAEGADRLVGYQQHVVAIADRPHPLEVARRRREAPAGILHRLQEDRGDGVRSLELDRLLDLVGGPPPELHLVVGVLGAR